ncbi:MAG: TetR/AcrR family transcriptional regulator [Candidatus Nanohaloarchaea archaeon]|nr:TetR/AcrR family transcriptional regulator [Candidatus Nanohaloarchaea archaeon]
MGPDRDGTRDEIMDAVFTALCERGYSDLTMQDIADELGKSKSLIHYHYDTKDELMDAFLEHITDRMGSAFEGLDGETATERLCNAVKDILFEMDDEGGKNVHRALIELRSVAPYRDGYPARFRKIEQSTREQMAAIIREGIENGEFDVDDPEMAADLVYEAFHGLIIEKVTSRFQEPMREKKIRPYIEMMLK